MKQNCSNCQFREWEPGSGLYCNAPKECSQWLYPANAMRKLELDRLTIGKPVDGPIDLHIALSESMPVDSIEIVGQDGRRVKIVNIGSDL